MAICKRLRWLSPIIILLCGFALLVVTATTRTVMSSASASASPNDPSVDDEVQMIWSPFRYVNATGATLRPRGSATTWTYPGDGCISATGANDVFNIHLTIPNESRIDYLRIYYYDTSARNSQAWVTVYDGAGETTDLTTVGSAGNAGYGTQLSAYLGHVVNTADRSYVLNWRSNQTGSTMRLCGLRVAYRIPLDNVAYLPVIVR